DGGDAGDERRVGHQEQRFGDQRPEARDRQTQDVAIDGATRGVGSRHDLHGTAGLFHVSPPAGWDAPHPTSVQEPTEVVCPRAGSRETVPCGETVVVTSPKTDAEAMRDALRRRGRPVPPRSTMHRLAALSLSNRAFIALVCIAVAILGVMSMSTLRQELIPSVTLPQIQ